ncbi:PaaI family thioesterase [Geobacillus sp. BMUD]|uniref:PaaI family thioesterase n=1 Tax=Geobacillus sp. BMUD TaxID=2508876 RepID=UPI0014931410|nr:PaaI family thioesterase [Geobacillus sp. BMUD]NNU82721.1 PaaI family thioesterase [Geobacillus sp. BMUD]
MKSTVNLHDVIAGQSAPPPCDTTLGVRLTEARDGYAKGVWKVSESLLNGNGVIMGGFVGAAADIVMAYAVTTLLRDDQMHASINLHTTFHRPMEAGEAEIEALVEKPGRTVAYVTATVRQNGKEVASATSSVLIMGKR